MDQVGVDPRAVEGGAAFHGPEDGLERLGLGVAGGVDLEPANAQGVPRLVLRTEGAHLHLHQPGQLAAQIIDVDPGSAVDVGGVFVG